MSVLYALIKCSQSSMRMEGIRRSAPNEQRIRRRDAKLLQRELAFAASLHLTKLPCPCRIHMREAELTIASYKRCIWANSRHPWFYGATEVCTTHLQFLLTNIYLIIHRDSSVINVRYCPRVQMLTLTPQFA